MIFHLDSAVGPGMAGVATGQLMNLQRYSRCLDVPGFDTSADHMMVFPCKQSANGTVQWNQKWFFTMPTKPDVTETGRIRVLNGSGVGYCLRTPGSTVMTVFVTLRPCAATGVLPVDQQWTFYTDTGDYATIYRIKNPDPLTNMTEG